MGSKQQTNDIKHKEENSGQINSDTDGFGKIRTTLGKFIHQLEIDSHLSNVLVNIYTGEESDQSVNVNKTTELRAKQMIEIQED